MGNQVTSAWRLTARYLAEGLGLALLTLICFRRGLDLATTAFAYLILITLLALMGGVIASVILSIAAFACLAYFFAPPELSFRIDSPQQIVLVVTFLLTSLTVTHLVGRARRQARAALQAEAALRRSEAHLADAQRLSRTGSIGWRTSTGELFWSEETFRIFEYDPTTKPTLQMAYDRVHPEEVALTKQNIERASWQEVEFDLQRRLLMPDGRVKHIHILFHPLRDSSGDLEYRGAVMDITASKQADEALRNAEARLRESQKMEAMGALAGGIAHDFNNILGVILGYGELAENAAPEGSLVRRCLGNMMNAGGRGKALVERILTFSRSGLGERGPINVQAVIEEALELLGASLAPGVHLEKCLEAGRAAVIGDATQLHQVAMNLCTNALQAMENGGVLQVALDRAKVAQPCSLSHGDLVSGAYVRLRVSDTGSGIPRHVLDRMFDPFFTTKSVAGGTGLGLALVHGIVTDLGGSIDVRTIVGCGTTFTIWLPIGGETAQSFAEVAVEVPRGRGQSVMIVDDEKLLVTLAEELLAELGYEPIGFNSSAAALAAFRAAPRRFDIVLTDETMPELVGTDLAREIRQLRPDIPIVLASGYSGAPLQERAHAVAIQEVLRKPLQRKDIAECLRRVLPWG